MIQSNLICYFNFFYSSFFTSNLENFVSFSWFVNLFFYLHSHFERIFSILQFICLLDAIALCWFNALCNSKLARYIYYQCSFDLFSILQPNRPSKFARAVLYPYVIPACHLLIQMLVLFLVSFNVYATPIFSQLCSPSACFFSNTSYSFWFKFDYLVALSF